MGDQNDDLIAHRISDTLIEDVLRYFGVHSAQWVIQQNDVGL